MRGIIDRIGNDVVTAEMPGRIMREFAVEEFPQDIKAGDVFVISETGQIIMQPEETDRRKQSARALFDRLKKQ